MPILAPEVTEHSPILDTVLTQTGDARRITQDSVSCKNSPSHEFLIQAGLLLHKYGTPSHRLEAVLTQIAQSLGIEGAFLYTPTALIYSLQDDSGEATYVRRVDSGAIDVDKLIQRSSLEEIVASRNPSS